MTVDDETRPDDSSPGFECGASAAPMHYLFEIQLITNEIVGKASAGMGADFARMVKAQHVRRYLLNYYREHAVLPSDQRYLGMTRPLNQEVGMVDFGAIRQKVQADSQSWNGRRLDSPEAFEGVPDYPLHDESEAAASEPAPDRVVFDLRQALARRGKKD